MSEQNLVNRRDFVKTTGTAVAATSLLGADAFAQAPAAGRRRYAIIGTGERATGMWGRQIRERYSDVVEFVGLCDINPKRVEASKALMGVDCATYTNFDEMLKRSPTSDGTKRDSFPHLQIVRRSIAGRRRYRKADVHRQKLSAVLDAEKRNRRRDRTLTTGRRSIARKEVPHVARSAVFVGRPRCISTLSRGRDSAVACLQERRAVGAQGESITSIS